MSHFGQSLGHMRRDLGLSQSALALRLGTTQRHLSFLETGRTRPTREMVGRIVTGLGLSATQRAALLTASGFLPPEPPRAEPGKAALDMLERRLLANWPFPGLILDPNWTILRRNAPAERMFAAMGIAGLENLLEAVLSPPFRAGLMNWEEASASLYLRLVAAARTSPALADRLEQLKRDGAFDHIPGYLTGDEPLPSHAAMTFTTPQGPLSMTSVVGHLGTFHDARTEGYEVELMMPADEASEALLRGLLEG